MLKKALKGIVICSIVALPLIFGVKAAQASIYGMEDDIKKDVSVNEEADLKKEAEEYFDSWETITEEELPEGLVPLKFDSELEAYKYLKENDPDWLSAGDEIFVLESEEVSKEVYDAAWENDF